MSNDIEQSFSTAYHMSMSIKGALRNRMFRGFTDKQGNPLTPKMAEAHLRLLDYNGVKLMKISECDNWDAEKGCLGHRKLTDLKGRKDDGEQQ